MGSLNNKKEEEKKLINLKKEDNCEIIHIPHMLRAWNSSNPKI